MSIERVREYLRPFGAEGRIREFPVSSATVELAAEALGVEPARIAKSLSFQGEGHPLLVVAAGDCRIDNRRFKTAFQRKAKMLTREEAHDRIGHDVGGVCPFALPPDVPVYLDVSLRRFATVFPAAGSANSAIELTCEELERLCSNFAGWVDVSLGRPAAEGNAAFPKAAAENAVPSPSSQAAAAHPVPSPFADTDKNKQAENQPVSREAVSPAADAAGTIQEVQPC